MNDKDEKRRAYQRKRYQTMKQKYDAVNSEQHAKAIISLVDTTSREDAVSAVADYLLEYCRFRVK